MNQYNPPRQRPRVLRPVASHAPTRAMEYPDPVYSDPYATQVISRAFVARWYRRVVWLALSLSFALSVVGNVRMFGLDVARLGDAAYFAGAAPWLALLGAGIYQLIVQLFQFRFAPDPRLRLWYWLLIALSVIPSLWTFAPLLNLIEASYRIGYVWIYGGAAIVLALNDRAQEWALQKRG